MAVTLLTVGCSDDEPALVPTTTEPTTVQAPSSDLADCSHRPSGTSPAVFDPTAGTYAAQSVAVVGERQLRFDVVQWLSGDDADEAYFRDSGDDSGAPNDYYIVNQSHESRTAPVAGDASILVLRPEWFAGSLHTVPLDSSPQTASRLVLLADLGDDAVADR